MKYTTYGRKRHLRSSNSGSLICLSSGVEIWRQTRWLVPAIVRPDSDLIVAKVGMTLLMRNTRGSQSMCLTCI